MSQTSLAQPHVASLRPHEVRALVRAGRFDRLTTGAALGYAQGNLVILPSDRADDFLRFCQRNPRSCPLLGLSEPGEPTIPSLGNELDVRTDLPGYRVYRNGQLAEERKDIRELWGKDSVAFVIGCWFSLEDDLLRHGVRLRHLELGIQGPMFRTAIDNVRAGAFGGKMVVSMRPFSPPDAIRAIQVTSRYPAVHGAPLHIGNPILLGIQDLSAPDFGEPITLLENEIPLYWGCGVTPQVAIEEAHVPICITHSPGRMLVTDVPNHRLAAL